MLNLVKSWLQYAQNRVARPTSVTNRVFKLAIEATLINRAHYALCMCFLLMCTTDLIRVGKGRRQHNYAHAA